MWSWQGSLNLASRKLTGNMTNVRTLLHLLTPWSTVLLEKLTGSQSVKKFPTFYGARRFITTFTSIHQLSLSWASSIQSIPPHPTSWRSILILSSYLRLGLPSGLFSSGFTGFTFLQGGVISNPPNPLAEGPRPVGCPQLLIQYIRSYPPYRRPFPHPQPEDAPCRGDRDPLLWTNAVTALLNNSLNIKE